MGARVAVLVVRHGCGFDLFPTNATLPSGFSYAYTIQNAPFQQGQGDLVRDFVASCRKYNVTPGFYAQVRASRLRLLVPGSWVGARRPFQLSLLLTAPRVVLPQDPGTRTRR